MDEKILTLLGEYARDVPPVGHAQLAASVVYKKQMIGLGWNSKKSHPFQAAYSSRKERIFFHAEIAAIKNALHWLNGELSALRKSTLYICRYSKKYGWGIAKPCDGCVLAIQNFEIKRVVYSLYGRGKLEELR
jgi:tRNA(Arg) A34 adenosine deaminase TadA